MRCRECRFWSKLSQYGDLGACHMFALNEEWERRLTEKEREKRFAKKIAKGIPFARLNSYGDASVLTSGSFFCALFKSKG